MRIFFMIVLSCLAWCCTNRKTGDREKLLSLVSVLREQSQWEAVVKLCEVADAMDDGSGDDQKDAEFLIEKGRAYLYLENTDAAREAFAGALNLVGAASSGVAGKVWYEAGNLLYVEWAYRGAATLDSSRACLKKALYLGKLANDSFLVNMCMYRLGAIHQIMKQSDSSRYYFQSALALATSAGDTLGMARSYTHLAQEFKNEGNLHESIRYDSMAIVFARKKKALYSLCFYLTNLAEDYHATGRTQQAVSLLTESLHYADLLNNGLVLGRNYLMAGGLYAKTDPALARQFYEKAKDIGEIRGYAFYVRAAEQALQKNQ